MTVARLVYFALPDRQVWGVRATWLTRLFVWLDILSFIIQAAGGITMAQDGAVRIGQNVYTAGLAFQGFFILIFGVMAQAFYVKMNRLNRADKNVTRVKLLVWIMYAVLLLIMVSPGFSLLV